MSGPMQFLIAAVGLAVYAAIGTVVHALGLRTGMISRRHDDTEWVGFFWPLSVVIGLIALIWVLLQELHEKIAGK